MKKRVITVIGIIAMAAGLTMSGCGQEEKDSSLSVSGGEKIQSSGEEDTGDLEGYVVYPGEVAENLERPQIPSFSKEDIRGVEVVSDGDVVYQLNYTPRDDRDSYLYWDMVTPYSSTAIVDTEEMYNIYETLAEIDFSAVANVQDGTDTGIGNSGSYILINYYACPEDEDQQVNPDNTLKLLVGNTDADGENYYCSLEGYETTVYEIPVNTINRALKESPYSLILKIPYLVNIATVGEVQISYGGKDYTMTLDGDTYKINGKKTEQDTYQTLFSDLMQPMIVGEVTSTDEIKGDREPYISITYLRNIDSAPDYRVVIYEYGEDQYTISVNGEENFFLSAEDVDTLCHALKDAF